MRQNKKIILGSQSPRRSALLKQMELEFTLASPDFEELIPTDRKPEAVPAYFAQEKALSLKHFIDNSNVILCFDTIVLHEEKILGKPKSTEEAIKMLQSMSGKKHEVISGACLLLKEQSISFTESTKVWMDHLSQDEIQYYIQEFQPFDKAGSYGIQEWLGITGIKKIEGCYYNVMGLPAHALYRHLKSLRIIEY